MNNAYSETAYCEHNGELGQYVACADCGTSVCTDCAIREGERFQCPDCKETPACPNCGERGGEPMVIYSREFQGCREHGGMVECEEVYCSKCASEFRRAA